MHFYALGWDGVLEMEVTWFCKLYARIPVVEARRHLALLPILAFPHLADKQSRHDIQEKLVRQAGYTLQRTLGQDTAAQARGWAALRGFGIPPPTNGA